MLAIKEMSSQLHSCCGTSQQSAYLLLRGPLFDLIAAIYAAQLGHRHLCVLALAVAWQNMFGNYLVSALCAPFTILHLSVPNPLPCFQAELITSLLSTVLLSFLWLSAAAVLRLCVSAEVAQETAQYLYFTIPAFIARHAIGAIEKSLHNTTTAPLRISIGMSGLFILLLFILPSSLLALATLTTIISTGHLFLLLITNRIYPLPPLSPPPLFSYLQYLPGTFIMSYATSIVDIIIVYTVLQYSYPVLHLFFALYSCLRALLRPLQLAASSSIINHMAQHHTYLARLTAHTSITTTTLLCLVSGSLIAVILILHPGLITSHDELQHDVVHAMYNFPLLCFVNGWYYSLLNVLKTTFKDRLLLPLYVCIDSVVLLLVLMAILYGDIHASMFIFVYIARTLVLTVLCNIIVARINWLMEVNHRTWQRLSAAEEPILLDITYIIYAHDEDEHLPPSVYETSWFGALQAILGVPSRQIENESVQLIADAFDDTENAEVEV